MLQGRLSKLLADKRTLKAAVIIGAAAIALLFASSFIGRDTDSGSDQAKKYAEAAESRLLEIVRSIDGVGEAKIFLTMDDGGESVYVKNSDRKTVSIEPKVRGVVIVCEGGDDPVVAARVLDAVTKSLDVGSDKVCITK